MDEIYNSILFYHKDNCLMIMNANLISSPRYWGYTLVKRARPCRADEVHSTYV